MPRSGMTLLAISVTAFWLAQPLVRAEPGDGLVAHYPFDDGFEDASGYSNHGSPSGGVTLVALETGSAARFDGSGGVTVTRPGVGGVGGHFTLNVWARFDSVLSELTLIELRDDPPASSAFVLGLSGNALNWHRTRDDGAKPVGVRARATRLDVGEWTMLTAVESDGLMTLYVNTVPVGVVQRSRATPTGPKSLFVGTRMDGNGSFAGLLDDLRLYDRAPDPGELDRLYELGRATLGEPQTCGQAKPCPPWTAAGTVNPVVLRPGYAIAKISDAVASDNVAQLAFKPGDTDHVYVVQEHGGVTRYDFDRVSGQLSNAVVIASGLGQWLGLAFHGDDLYVSMDLGGSRTQRPGDGRISRFSDTDGGGVYQTRHDFVHSIDKGAHDVNHLQIVGDTLYVGIGAVGRKGDPAEENVYTMTIARIVDLTQIDFSGPIDSDFKGPVNYLADETEWLDTAGADGQLRYYASGFRNPFGIAIDTDGDLWVSTNGNSDSGFLTLDYLYKKVPLGGQGSFPPAEFGFGPPWISGAPIGFLSDLGQNPAPTGLDFVPAGPDAGMVVLAQAGASDQVATPVGKDVLIVDPDTGVFEILVDDLNLPTDIVQDSFGRLLVADYGDDSIWLLTPPLPSSGSVPDGDATPGTPLTVNLESTGDVTLSWDAACGFAQDYAVYEGNLGDFIGHAPRLCSTGGATTATITPGGDRTYYVVVPTNGVYEGSYGSGVGRAQRVASPSACYPQDATPCQ